MSILCVKVQNSLIVRAFTKRTVIMHEITEGIPSGHILIDIKYGVQYSTFLFAVGQGIDDIQDVNVVYDTIKTLE